jgi:Rrf2 family protein
MKLSTKTRYGLRVLIQLAESQKKNTFTKGRVIAEEQEISLKYLEQIMHILKSVNFVKTYKGHKGGYALALPATEIKLLDILELFEGSLNFVHCVEAHANCKRSSTCPAIKVWEKLSAAVKKETSGVTLQALTVL